MLIRVLAIWFVCGAALFAIHNSDPAPSPALQAQLQSAANTAQAGATDPQAVLAHLRCVAPVIEGRNLRTMITSVDSPANQGYVMAPARKEIQAAGACGTGVLAASR